MILHGIILVAQPTCVLVLSINGKLICQVMEGMHFHLPFNAYEATGMSFFVFCILYHDCRSFFSINMIVEAFSDFPLRSIISGRLSRLWSDSWKLFSSVNGASWKCCSKVETASERWRKPHTSVYDGTWGRWISQISGLRGASESRFSWCSETNERKAQVRVITYICLLCHFVLVHFYEMIVTLKLGVCLRSNNTSYP